MPYVRSGWAGRSRIRAAISAASPRCRAPRAPRTPRPSAASPPPSPRRRRRPCRCRPGRARDVGRSPRSRGRGSPRGSWCGSDRSSAIAQTTRPSTIRQAVASLSSGEMPRIFIGGQGDQLSGQAVANLSHRDESGAVHVAHVLDAASQAIEEPLLVRLRADVRRAAGQEVRAVEEHVDDPVPPRDARVDAAADVRLVVPFGGDGDLAQQAGAATGCRRVADGSAAASTVSRAGRRAARRPGGRSRSRSAPRAGRLGRILDEHVRRTRASRASCARRGRRSPDPRRTGGRSSPRRSRDRRGFAGARRSPPNDPAR